tara:strand:+ start:323 stop:592 length:270 start_codon:yes stop_codon:yes gene_type:complete
MKQLPDQYVTSNDAMDQYFTELPTSDSWRAPYWKSKMVERFRELGLREFRVRGIGIGQGQHRIAWLRSEVEEVDRRGLFALIVEEIKAT